MRRTIPIFLIQFASCLSAAAYASEPSDLADQRSARSLIAEAAEVIGLMADNKVNATYTQVMKENARAQLRDIDENAGKTDPELHRAIAGSMTALERNDARGLRTIAEQLFAKAGPRGPAD